MTLSVTPGLLRRLIDSPAEHPVLYVDTDSGSPELDVWAEAYVAHNAIVATRTELVDAFGEDWTDDEIEEFLTECQEIADEIAERLTPEEPGPHFTAWLVNDPSALNQDNCDVTVLADVLIGYDKNDSGEETPCWASNGAEVFHAVTDTSARDGDIEDALSRAEELLAEAGWDTVGKWEAVDNAYLVTVERSDPDEEWTLAEVTERIEASSTKYADTLLRRWGVEAVGRQPGRGGQSLYRALDVLAAKGARPGQGARTDLEDQA
jgi:hypothetical protein